MFNLSNLEHQLSRNVFEELQTYLYPPKYKLLDWVEQNIDKMDIYSMASDWKCNNILIKHKDRIDERTLWNLCKNTLIDQDIICLLEENIQQLTASCWTSLCQNPKLVDLLQKNIHLLESPSWDDNIKQNFWEAISQNTNCNVVDILLKTQHKSQWFDWHSICKNHLKMGQGVKYTSLTLTLIESNIQYLTISCWKILSSNPRAIPILEKNQTMKMWFDWNSLSKLGEALDLLEANREMICWDKLALNPNSKALNLIIEQLQQDPDTIDNWVWAKICSNTNPDFIDFISHNIDKLDQGCWYYLSKNPAAIPLLMEHQDQIHWGILYENPGIYVKDREIKKKN